MAYGSVNVPGNPNVGAADKLSAPRNIDGVAFDGSADISHYGICSTAAATAGKAVALTGFTLAAGAAIRVKFTATNTAANPTLNVNGTGAKAIYYRGAAIAAGYLAANRTYEFVYNGTQYEVVGDIDTNTTYTPAAAVPKAPGTAAVGTSAKYAREDHVHPVQTSVTGNAGSATKLAAARTIDGVAFDGSAAIGHYGTCSVAEDAADCVVALPGFSLVAGARIAVKFTNNVTKNLAPTLNVNGTGAKPIYIADGNVGHSGIWGAGKVVEFLYDGTKWLVINPAFETGYSKTLGGDAHAEGYKTTASGANSHAEGGPVTGKEGSKAIGINSHAEGSSTTASGESSHAEGQLTTASGVRSHAEGYSTAASGQNSHAEGYDGIAEGMCSHVEGGRTTDCEGNKATGYAAHAEGSSTTASGESSHAGGNNTIASAACQTAIGRYNVEYATSSASTANTDAWLIVGKGTSTARANAFRVKSAGVAAAGAYASSGADYAELFEWQDGNPDAEDRAGRFVTLDGDKLRLAGPEDDFVLGIISGNPSVIGDVHDDQWQGMYLYDIYGRPIWEDVEVPAETAEEPDPEDPGKTITKVIVSAHTERRQKLNPDYDGGQQYIPRTERPEWGCVGMMGKLVVVDDGTCKVNGWCKPGEGGVATASTERTDFRVMARIDETHVRVLVLGRR